MTSMPALYWALALLVGRAVFGTVNIIRDMIEDAWDIDVEGGPEIAPQELEGLRRRGEEIMERQTRFIASFARAFQAVDLNKALGAGAAGGTPARA